MNKVIEVDFRAMMQLKACREKLTKQEYTSLRGQILAGDSVGAMRGLQTILERR